jgi:hypothetical protein
MVGSEMVMTYQAERLSYEDACSLSRSVLAGSGQGQVSLEMDQVRDTTTAALARLVLLRRDLLRSGRDLRVLGLRGRAELLYEVNRLHDILPRQQATEADSLRLRAAQNLLIPCE